ncbi:MAG TPA: Na/Pi cotransporter family protein, partial [Burkholderiaceae bacterium]|nr:Na/Pi cotransporter family protein [Burkholderiaceae bacterium]
MLHLLNLLAAIALLVWGTHIVRTGMLRVFGENLRTVLAKSFSNRLSAVLSGLGVTSLVQSSTATCLILASFAAKGLVATSAALAVMLGADVGTALMAVVYSFDLSWLSPLLIFVGVVMFISRQDRTAGRIGRVLIGLGLITLALQLIVGATKPLTESPAVRALLVALPNEVLLDIVVGATLTVLSYSSLAIVLLTATLATSGMIPTTVALGLVLGANVGSGVLALLATANAAPQARRLPLGTLLFKAPGAVIAIPLLPYAHPWLQDVVGEVHQQVVVFHLLFNVALAILFIGLTGVLARWVDRWLPDLQHGLGSDRPRHLDPVALATPSLAISCAAREALHQADVVETMLRGVLDVIRKNDLELAEALRRKDDTVDELYSAIKFYLTQISREALSEREGRRWGDVLSFTINMEQVGDIIERVL